MLLCVFVCMCCFCLFDVVVCLVRNVLCDVVCLAFWGVFACDVRVCVSL